jgi:hypothetical protein
MSDGQPHFVPPHDLRCRFVKTSGARCTQPALRDHDLCFDHKFKLRTIRGQVRRLQREEPLRVPLITHSLVEDHHSILRNLNEIALQLANGAISVHQATAFTCLQRTCLKTLRQMHDIETCEPQVEAYVEVDGQPMALPEDSPAAAAAQPGVAAQPDAPLAAAPVAPPRPAAAPAGKSTEQSILDDPDALEDLDPKPEPVDAPPSHEHAPPRVPGLSFNPRTEEGNHNLGQEYIWGYCHKDPVKGLEFGIDLNWPGRPAGFILPPHLVAALAAPTAAQPTPEPSAATPEDAPQPNPGTGLSLNAAADSAFATPAESMNPRPSLQPTSLESTHTRQITPKLRISHTCALSTFFSGHGIQPPHPGSFSRSGAPTNPEPEP